MNPNDNIKPLCAVAYDLINSLLANGPDLVLDIGANVGGFSKHFAARAKRVHAFEPVPDMFLQLQATAQQVANVVPFQLGMADVAQRLTGVNVFNCWTLLPDTTARAKAREYHDKPPFDIDLTTIDLHCATHGDPDFIKLDVDGYEMKALQGGLRTLGRKPCPIMFEYSFLPTLLGDAIPAMAALIYGLGYRAWSMDGKYVADTEQVFLAHYPAHTSYDVVLVHRSQR